MKILKKWTRVMINNKWWKRLLFFIYRKCPAGNYHWIWQRFCFCRLHINDDGWKGGVYDMWKKREYIDFGNKFSNMSKK